MSTKRQTGRTTRMLEHAKDAARNGRAVYVMAASAAEVARLKRLLGEEGESLGIKVETAGSVGNLDWESMTLRGAWPNCLVVADHYAIESRFRKMLEELTRYDLP